MPVATRMSGLAATLLLALLLMPSPVAARDPHDPITVPLPVHLPVDFAILVKCGERACFFVSSEPCAGLVVGPVGVVYDTNYGVFLQAGTLDGGPTAYGGYHDACEGRETFDDEYVEHVLNP